MRAGAAQPGLRGVVIAGEWPPTFRKVMVVVLVVALRRQSLRPGTTQAGCVGGVSGSWLG